MELVKLNHNVFNLELEITNITSQGLRQLRSVPVCTANTIISEFSMLVFSLLSILSPTFSSLHRIFSPNLVDISGTTCFLRLRWYIQRSARGWSIASQIKDIKNSPLQQESQFTTHHFTPSEG